MLRIEDITFAIDGRRLFEGASATIPAGHKVGFVGPNGAGKTTLFKLIREEMPLESGTITLPNRARIGGVAQEVPASATSLLDTVLEADTERAALLADTSTDPARIADVQARLADIDAWSAEARAATILKGLGFDSAAQARPCSDFSGGWRMRVALAAVLFSAPDLLLLDEPTNYLDLEGAVWLESYLARYPHTVLIISHDRGLLNRAVGSILHLEAKQLKLYTGGYDDFAKARVAQRAVQAAAAKKQADQRAHLESFVRRFKAKATKAKQAQSRVKALEKMEIITPPEETAKRRFTFPQPGPLSPPIVNIENGAVGYGDAPVLRKLNLRIDQDDRIALLGKNGEGKSTLTKLISGRLAAMEGRMVTAKKLKIGYFAQHQLDDLHADQTPLEHLQAERPSTAPKDLRAKLAGFGLGADQADVVVGKLSGGQKARLSLLLATLDAPHLLILDEPTNHLDMESREALVAALNTFEGAVILVSHDEHILSLVADRLWLVKDGAVRPFEEDLTSYRALILETSGKGASKGKAKAKTDATPKAPKPSRDQILAARADVRKCEARLEKLTEMSEKLQKKLADPDIYEDARRGERETWQAKYAEVEEALMRAEALWLSAGEALETLEGHI